MIRKGAVTAVFFRVALRLSVFAVKFKLNHYRMKAWCGDWAHIM